MSIYVEALRREIVFKLQCVIRLVLGEATPSSFQPHQCAHTIAVLKVFFVCLFFVNLRGEIYSLILPSDLFFYYKLNVSIMSVKDLCIFCLFF